MTERLQVIQNLSNLPEDCRGAVLALGNFEGVHAGHRAVLEETVRLARLHRTKPGVITFTPHPREFFQPECAPLSIYPLPEKLKLLEDEKIELVLLMRFDKALATLEAERFVKDILVEKAGAVHVVTGKNFVFGRGRKGDSALLARMAEELGFGYTAIDVEDEEGEICSSTRIRAHLSAGEVEQANALLSHDYCISGEVVSGQQLGQKIGFPTANLKLDDIFHPAWGVYAAWTEVDGGEMLASVINIGVRPTVGGDVPLLEVHLLDGGEIPALYGRQIAVYPVHYLRPEQKFPSVEELTAQIARDADTARDLLKQKLCKRS